MPLSRCIFDEFEEFFHAETMRIVQNTCLFVEIC